MGSFIKGDVVVVPFPFSDLSETKVRRPALVITRLDGEDLILCMITTQFRSDRYVITLFGEDFVDGSIDKDSYIRPNRLFTADSKLVIEKRGILKTEKIDEVVAKLIEIIKS